MAHAATIDAHAPRALPGWWRPSTHLAMLTAALVALGVVMVASVAAGGSNSAGAFAGALMRRLSWTGLGLVAFTVGACVDYQFLRRHNWAIAALALGSLVAVLVPGVGLPINHARRWIGVFGGFTIQPSEFAKIGLLIWIAAWCERNAWTRARRRPTPRIRTFTHGFLFPMAVVGVAGVLLLAEPDFGAAVVLGALCTAVLLACGARPVFFLLAAVAMLPLAEKLVVEEPYRMRRIMAFLHPWQDADGAGYQLIQSLIAMGSGGLTGRGLGLGVQKLGFLPTATSDFIFSILGEELGFIGAAVVILLYVWLVWTGVRVALRAPDTFGFALGLGITMLIGLQAALNIAVVTGSVPTKGLSLPLISAGGSSLVATMWAAGILLNIARAGEDPEARERRAWYSDVPLYQQRIEAAARALVGKRGTA